MKDYDKDEHDPRPDSALRSKLPAKTRDTDAGEATPHRSVSATKTDDGQAERPGILQHEQLSHPANAGQLAGILSELQKRHGNAYVQRVVAEMNEPKPGVEAQMSGGQKLDDGVKAEMETAFGESFSDVRIHTGGEAERINEELGARAVTRGRDVYFDGGQYEPSSAEGKARLAHELAHVVQQAGDSTRQQAGSVDQAGDKFEEEADRAASAVLSGGHAQIAHRSAAPSFQRQARPEVQQKQIAGAILLDRQPGGPLAGEASYTYTAATRQLTISGPRLNYSDLNGGELISDSARATMAPPRVRTIVIRITDLLLTISVNGTPYRFVR